MVVLQAESRKCFREEGATAGPNAAAAKIRKMRASHGL